jgi:hypothetical protein
VVAATAGDRQLLDVADAASAWRALERLKQHDDPLLAMPANACTRLPADAHLVWEQIRRARYLSLAQVFQMEYTMSLNCCRHPEFSEGVRAACWTRTTSRWHWPDVAQVPAAVVEAHFAKAWEGGTRWRIWHSLCRTGQAAPPLPFTYRCQFLPGPCPPPAQRPRSFHCPLECQSPAGNAGCRCDSHGDRSCP